MTKKTVGRFVMTGFPRTGTTALVSYLDSHPDIACYHEPFNPSHAIEPKLDPVELVRSIFSTGVTIEDRSGFGIVNRPHDGKSLSVGFKILLDQAFALPSVCREILRQPDVGVILVRRKNTLRMLTSMHLAHATGQWRSYTATEASAKVTISLKELATTVATEEKVRQHLVNILSVSGNPLCELLYEDLCEKPDQVLRDLQSWLGVPTAQLKTQFVKVNTRPLADTLANYAELFAQTRGSHLAELFDDV